MMMPATHSAGKGTYHNTSIPDELKTLRQWVLWRYALRNDKKTKIPYQPNGKEAKSNTPETWVSFEEALEAYQLGSFDGIGFVFSDFDPYTGIDLDWKTHKDENIPSDAKAIIDALQSYTEFSVSGKGCHIIVRGRLPESGRRKKLNSHLEVEMYSSGRYFCMTGLHLEDSPLTIEDRQDRLKELHDSIFSEPKKPQQPVAQSRLENDEIIEKAIAAKNGAAFTALWQGDIAGYGSQSEADLALANHLYFWSGGNAETIDDLFRRSGLYRKKWDEKHYGNGLTYGQATIAKVLERGGLRP
jgi:primase-polymerase (primpol)-like protein